MKIPVFARAITFALLCAPMVGFTDVLLIRTLDALSDEETAIVDGASLLSPRLLADFYAQRGNKLAWTDHAKREALLEAIEASPSEGLSPSDFHVDVVRAMARPRAFEGLSLAARLSADIQLSDALLRYAHHTRFGKLDPKAVDPKWNDRGPAPAEALLADMREALDAKDLGDFLTTRLNHPFWYDNLKYALARLTRLEHLKEMPPLPSGPNLSKGWRDPRVDLVRERLRSMGYGTETPSEHPELFDEGLADAVKRFQNQVGLVADAVVGPRTLAALNSPVDEDRVDQVRINLERMRWLFDDLPADYIFVDVADYKAQLIRGREIQWSTRVIVGSEKDQTPMFRDSMEHVVFNPTWTVPISIQKKMGNVSAKYTLVDRRTGRKISGGNASDYKRYRVVQKPGPGNALGRVKFIFPNRHAVYLHDTPSKRLFGRSRRALSHGCVRVQNPMKLAELLLGESGWTSSRIDGVIRGSRTRYVHLEQDLPVLLYYLTARADETGGVDFRRDIYGRDSALRAAFAKDVSSARIAFDEPTPLPAPDQAPGSDPEIDERGQRLDQRQASASQAPDS